MFQGSIPALVTPFRGGEVDFDALGALVEWHLAEGSHGLVPVGTTGESPTLSHEEHDAVVAAVAHRSFKALPVDELTRKVIRGGVFVDVKAAYDAAMLRGTGLRVWRL